jgi:hypothetical protein
VIAHTNVVSTHHFTAVRTILRTQQSDESIGIFNHVFD